MVLRPALAAPPANRGYRHRVLGISTGQGVDQGVPGLSVGADLVVAERAFEHEAGSLGDTGAAEVAGVAPDLDAPGSEGVEGEGGYSP